MCLVDDSIVHGQTVRGTRVCQRCGKSTLCIEINGVTLPEGITLKATILQDRTQSDPSVIRFIGIGCGCYARFHRQIAIVREKMGIPH